MPLPGWLARFNRRVTNRATKPLAETLPGFAVVMHTGRRSGRRYRTPVNLFRLGDGYAIALTYGRDRDWVRNVMAARGCEVQTRRRTIRLEGPRIVTDSRGIPVPAAIRPILKAFRVTEFMKLKESRHPDP
ncbi:MAG TPA: nitroreductase family deazaflavin-dependent oxidoreductase [Actinomycetota bacterium]|nr:nitroreductase family deazaflavin-dependent oxidoreductase [Actinomycetota bacterium]